MAGVAHTASFGCGRAASAPGTPMMAVRKHPARACHCRCFVRPHPATTRKTKDNYGVYEPSGHRRSASHVASSAASRRWHSLVGMIGPAQRGWLRWQGWVSSLYHQRVTQPLQFWRALGCPSSWRPQLPWWLVALRKERSSGITCTSPVGCGHRAGPSGSSEPLARLCGSHRLTAPSGAAKTTRLADLRQRATLKSCVARQATSNSTRGCREAIFSNTFAGPVGSRRPCSQFCNVS